MLPGLAGVAVSLSGAPISVSYGGGVSDTPPFSQSMSIGAAAPNRRVIVCIAVRDTLAAFGTVTVAGQSCTGVIGLNVDFGVGQQNIAMYITDAPVVSGTTATVVWDTVDSSGAAGLAQTYAIYGAGSSVDADGTFGTDPSLSVDIPEKGVAVAFAAVRTASDACVWTGATEGGQATATMLETSIAAYTTDDPKNGHTVQGVWTTGSVDSIIAATFRPE